MELRKNQIVLRAALVVTLGTMIGYYFPDLTFSAFFVWVCAVIATKYLTNFMWLGAVLAFIALAGTQNTGGHIPTFILARCLIGWFMSFLLVRQDLYDSKNK